MLDDVLLQVLSNVVTLEALYLTLYNFVALLAYKIECMMLVMKFVQS